MYVKKLKIENFRGIRQMELELHPKMNVFVGVNGAGKSSVLDALGHLFEPFVQFHNGQGATNIFAFVGFPESEIHNSEASAFLELAIARKKLPDLTYGKRSFSSPHYTLIEAHNIETHNIMIGPDGIPVDQSEMARDADGIGYTNPGQWPLYWGKLAEDCNIIVYYRARRRVSDVSIATWTNRSFRKQDAYIDALAPKVDFKEFFEWFRNREDLENEERAEGNGKRDRQLESVREVIGTFCGALKNVRVHRRDPLRMVVTKNDKELRIEQLSDGEKCLLAMVGDLARRLAISNPSLDNPLHGEGVVLIDEVDLHLHPQWQRMILPRLMETFPNCQFIVTTHSPQILGELEQGNGKIIPLQDGDNGIEIVHGDFNVFGQTSDVILVDVMETSKRNNDITKMLNEIFKAIDANNLDKARTLKNELEKKVDGIPEFAKIELLLHRKEKLGK